ncbi:MAG: cobyric acid synthase [Clostridiales bacterium]|nr:cobyric acid synthase [Clostridiales bacterium]
MFQGTASSVGKSMLCTALCRIFKQDGLRVAPFKAQNMALNSYATKEGLEMGRAQVTQAEAAGLEPSVLMNPVLLKPTSDMGSQVIVNGRAIGNMTAMEYQRYKPELRDEIRSIYEQLEASVDVVVIEGAGSPAEINLREGDIVNMAMAETADAPVILIGDIDLGGVFASLLGTVMLLTPEERARVKGFVINKFRGDVEILKPGLSMLEDMTGIPVIGVVPWTDIDLEDEDSVTQRFRHVRGEGDIRTGIVRLPHISNFTDFQMLSMEPDVSVQYITRPDQVAQQDIVILPGSKSTIDDLMALKRSGMADALVRHARAGKMLMGVCGGYQMLAEHLSDPEHTESIMAEADGLGLLPMDVRFHAEKTTVQAEGMICSDAPWLSELNGARLSGYEIHTGENTFHDGARPWLRLVRRGDCTTDALDGIMNSRGNVLGTYLHGLFDDGRLWRAVVDRVRIQKGMTKASDAPKTIAEYRERAFDDLAAHVRGSLDMDMVYRILRGEV